MAEVKHAIGDLDLVRAKALLNRLVELEQGATAAARALPAPAPRRES